MTLVSPSVENWSRCRSDTAAQWTPPQLVDAKGQARVSVVIPARNEQETVGDIIATVRGTLVERYPLVDELVAVDSRSDDATADVAAAAGATVVRQDDMTRGLPRLEGKGDALWCGLAATTGDVVVFVDADLREFQPHFVTGLVGPLLTDPSVAFAKASYRRHLVGDTGNEPDSGGRVTELVARPLLNLFWPELAGFVQPLAGEYAGRRAVLEQLPFVSGYGVEIAMLIDLLDMVGLDALAQVDLGARLHRHQDVEALGRMSAQILLAAWSRLQREGRASTAPVATLTQFGWDAPGCPPDVDRAVIVSDVAVAERPALARMRTADRPAPARMRAAQRCGGGSCPSPS